VVADVDAAGGLPRVGDRAEPNEITGDRESGLAPERAVADADVDHDARCVVVGARAVRGSKAFRKETVARRAEVQRRAAGPDEVRRAAERPRAGDVDDEV